MDHTKFIQENLLETTAAEFAIVALPLQKGSKRIFQLFQKVEEEFIDLDGNTLTINPFPSSASRTQESVEAPTKEQYLTLVQDAVESIKKGEMEKVVLARSKIVERVTRESLAIWYENLLHHYPQALVFIIAREKEVWIGASPELLIEKHDKNFHTIALAATSKDPTPQWSAKDYDEHDKVVSYLVRELKNANVEGLTTKGPYTSRFGSLRHLKTDVSFSSQLGINDIVQLLHPTPALCGYPKKAALKFIQENEGITRSFYTGSMVIEDPQGNGVSYAFLRCARLDGDCRLTCFAGCGVVNASVPLREWEESEAKLASVLDLLPVQGRR